VEAELGKFHRLKIITVIFLNWGAKVKIFFNSEELSLSLPLPWKKVTSN
jgi:hypothetical protein